jgi:hypothetical protein
MRTKAGVVAAIAFCPGAIKKPVSANMPQNRRAKLARESRDFFLVIPSSSSM